MATEDLQAMQRVFAYHVLREVVAADGTIDASEQAFLDAHHPPDQLRADGLLDGEGKPCASVAARFQAAVPELRAHLTNEQKLALIDTFLQASLADGQLHHSESDAVSRAAELLNLPSSIWLTRLEEQGLVGDVELPEPDGVEGALQLIEDVDGPTVTPADAATVTPGDD